jgi:hypothetical protein
MTGKVVVKLLPGIEHVSVSGLDSPGSAPALPATCLTVWDCLQLGNLEVRIPERDLYVPAVNDMLDPFNCE